MRTLNNWVSLTFRGQVQFPEPLDKGIRDTHNCQRRQFQFTAEFYNFWQNKVKNVESGECLQKSFIKSQGISVVRKYDRYVKVNIQTLTQYAYFANWLN